jgi:transposase-like protein
VVSAQTVSRLTRDLDALVHQFHQARLKDHWAYLFLDGVSLRVRHLAESRGQAVAAFRNFRARWRRDYTSLVKQLKRDLPELLSFFALPRHLWRKLRTTNIIERCFVEVRRRTRPMVCFVNVKSVDRIIYSI